MVLLRFTFPFKVRVWSGFPLRSGWVSITGSYLAGYIDDLVWVPITGLYRLGFYYWVSCFNLLSFIFGLHLLLVGPNYSCYYLD